MARVRAWAIRAIVVVLLVWPPIHHVLTRVYGMNPWYFFGWAMYAAPPNHVVVVIRGRRAGEWSRLELKPELKAAVETYRDRRSALGSLADPESIGRTVLSQHPELEAVMVVIRTATLDRESARVVATVDKWVVGASDRDDPGPRPPG